MHEIAAKSSSYHIPKNHKTKNIFNNVKPDIQKDTMVMFGTLFIIGFSRSELAYGLIAPYAVG